MYREPMLRVAKIENGYLLEVRASWKEKDEDSDNCCHSVGMGYGEKEIYAADPVDLAKKIEALMPLLDAEFGSQSEFEIAFNTVKA